MPVLHSAIPACPECKVACTLEIDDDRDWWLTCPGCHEVFYELPGHMIPLGIDHVPPSKGTRWS